MAQLTKKNLNETTLNNLAPPYLDYAYFKDCAQLPFRYESNIFDMVNAWWLIEAATLVYADKEFTTEKFKQNGGFQEVAYFDGKTTQCYVASTDKFAVVAFRGSEARLREGDQTSAIFLRTGWLISTSHRNRGNKAETCTEGLRVRWMKSGRALKIIFRTCRKTIGRSG